MDFIRSTILVRMLVALTYPIHTLTFITVLIAIICFHSPWRPERSQPRGLEGLGETLVNSNDVCR